MKKLFSLFVLLYSSFIFTTQAFAVAKTYVVAPFQINGDAQYKYLQNSIPSMLTSRLFWSGQYETSNKQEAIAKANPPASRSDAEKLLAQANADYIFYGSVIVMGSEMSVDVTALSKEGQQWQSAATSRADSLITDLQLLADKMSKDVFARTNIVSTGARPALTGAVPLSGDFVVNETGSNSVYLNPSFRYQGVDTERLNSQALNFATISMDIADITGDGVDDIIFADEGRFIYLYSWNHGVMQKIAEYKLPSSQRTLAVRTFQQKGKEMIAISTFSDNENKPLGIILEYDGKGFKEVQKRIPYYLNTASIPGVTSDMLIAQEHDNTRIFGGPVFELYINSNEYSQGPTLPNLPRDANVFNFTYLEDHESADGYRTVLLNNSEKINVYSRTGSRIHQTNDTFSGGNAYIKLYDGNLTPTSDYITTFYYIPMRMATIDLDSNAQYELLTNKPISTAAEIFKNFRNYPQGEIHSLVWDGIGLSLLWKTKRINGTVADFQIADPNNDGVLDLVVCVVTYPGAFGLGEKKTVITLYPLDTNLTDPNTPVHNSN